MFCLYVDIRNDTACSLLESVLSTYTVVVSACIRTVRSRYLVGVVMHMLFAKRPIFWVEILDDSFTRSIRTLKG